MWYEEVGLIRAREKVLLVHTFSNQQQYSVIVNSVIVVIYAFMCLPKSVESHYCQHRQQFN